MRRAFSLVELMVAMAIIAITVAILLPVYGRTRERAWRSACIAHLQQTGLAVAEYVGDHDGVALVAGEYIAWDTPHPVYGMGWLQRIDPYVDDLYAFHCPANSHPVFGYSMNAWTMSHVDDQAGIAPGDYAIDHAPAPSETPWLFDACAPDTDGGPEWSTLEDANCDPDNGSARAHKLPYQPEDLVFPGVHRGGNNLFFLDGHGKWWQHFPNGIGDTDKDAQLAYFEGLR